jgi:putative membrane protein
MRKLIALVAAIAALASITVTASAPAAESTGEGTVSAQDKAWLKEAIQTDHAEEIGGKAAKIKGQSKAVVKLGEKLALAHASSYHQHAVMAKAMGAPVPRGPSKLEQTELAKVAAMKGHAFDMAYAKSQIKGHLIAMKGAKKEIAMGSSRNVIIAAETAMQMYVMHLKWSEAVLKGL